jgi:hypothetical protein
MDLHATCTVQRNPTRQSMQSWLRLDSWREALDPGHPRLPGPSRHSRSCPHPRTHRLARRTHLFPSRHASHLPPARSDSNSKGQPHPVQASLALASLSKSRTHSMHTPFPASLPAESRGAAGAGRALAAELRDKLAALRLAELARGAACLLRKLSGAGSAALTRAPGGEGGGVHFIPLSISVAAS